MLVTYIKKLKEYYFDRIISKNLILILYNKITKMASVFLPIDKIEVDYTSKSNILFSELLELLFKIYFYLKIESNSNTYYKVIKCTDIKQPKFKKCVYGLNCNYNKFKNCKFLHPKNFDSKNECSFNTLYNDFSKNKQFINYADNNFNIEIFQIKDYFNKYNEQLFENKVNLHYKYFCIDEYLDYKNFKYCQRKLSLRKGLIIIIKIKKKHLELNNIYENITCFFNNIINPIYKNIDMNNEYKNFINYFKEYKELELQKEKEIKKLIIKNLKEKKYEISYKNKILVLSNWIRCYEYYIEINLNKLNKKQWKDKFGFAKPNILNSNNISLLKIKQLLAKKQIPEMTWNQIPDKFKNIFEEKYFQRPLNIFDNNKFLNNLILDPDSLYK